MKTAVSIFLIAFILFFVSDKFFETKTSMAQDEPTDQILVTEVDNNPESAAVENQVDSAQVVKEDNEISMVRWHEDDVIESKINNQDYGSYDDSTLEELIKNGDVKAMKVLALRYLNKEDRDEKVIGNMEKYDQLMSKAILYGDRQSLPSLPELSKEINRLHSPQLTEEEKLDVVLNILSYHEFMAMRGSAATKYDEQITFFAAYKHLGLPSSFSDEQKSIIRERGKKFYDQMEQKRIELGLGPFDNSIPVSAQKAYEMQKQRYLSKLGPLAIE